MKELFQLLKRHNLSPNGFYLIYCLGNNTNFELNIPLAAELYKLQEAGYVDEKNRLTNKAKIVLIESGKIYLRNVKSIKDELDTNYKDNIEKYRMLFPSGVIEGKRLRCTSAELTPKFVWFFKTYPQFTWDNVLNATKSYLESKASDMKYCRNASYFIKKTEHTNTISDLASWCESYIEESNEPKKINEFDKLI